MNLNTRCRRRITNRTARVYRYVQLKTQETIEWTWQQSSWAKDVMPTLCVLPRRLDLTSLLEVQIQLCETKHDLAYHGLDAGCGHRWCLCRHWYSYLSEGGVRTVNETSHASGL
jgi:hypothetical protein